MTDFYHEMFGLQGRRAVVTGAASGMGEMEARIIAAEGGRVVLTDIAADLGAQQPRRVGRPAIVEAEAINAAVNARS